MPQTSFLRGAQASSSVFNASTQATSVPGVVSPVTFSVSGSLLSISAHRGVFGSGLTIVSPDVEVLDLSKVTTGASAFTNTVAWVHDVNLYTQPKLVLLNQTVLPGAQENVLVLGWLNYPGASVSIASGHFIPALAGSTMAIIESWNWVDILDAVPVSVSAVANTPSVSARHALSSPTKYQVTLVLDGASTPVVVSAVTDVSHGSGIMITNSGTQNYVVTMRLPVFAPTRPSSVHMRTGMDSGVSVTAGIRIKGQENSLSAGSLIGALGTGDFTFSILDTLIDDSVFDLVFTITIPASKSIWLHSLGVSTKQMFGSVFTSL